MWILSAVISMVFGIVILTAARICVMAIQSACISQPMRFRHCGLHLTYSFAAHLIVVNDRPVHQRARRNHNQNKKDKQNKKHVIQ
jgi:choline-glycine betaine transporter